MKKVNRNNGAIDVTTVGGRIKKLRTDAGYTQEELAARLHLEGKSAISNYENNSRGVSAEMLTQLSRLFHVSADYILNGDTPDNLDPIVNEAIEILNLLLLCLGRFRFLRAKVHSMCTFCTRLH